MSFHPIGEVVEVIRLQASDNGRFYSIHEVCGCVVGEDLLFCFRKVQVIVEGKEKIMIAAYWVIDGVDQCHVGFLPKHIVKHHERYEGRLVQVTELYQDSCSPCKRRKNNKNNGCCLAALIEIGPTIPPPTKKLKK